VIAFLHSIKRATGSFYWLCERPYYGCIYTAKIHRIENENSLCVYKLCCWPHAYPTIFI